MSVTHVLQRDRITEWHDHQPWRDNDRVSFGNVTLTGQCLKTGFR